MGVPGLLGFADVSGHLRFVGFLTHLGSLSVPCHLGVMGVPGHLWVVDFTGHLGSVGVLAHLEVISIPNATFDLWMSMDLLWLSVFLDTLKLYVFLGTLKWLVFLATLPFLAAIGHLLVTGVSGHLGVADVPGHLGVMGVPTHLCAVNGPDHHRNTYVSGYLGVVGVSSWPENFDFPTLLPVFGVSAHLVVVDLPGCIWTVDIHVRLESFDAPSHFVIWYLGTQIPWGTWGTAGDFLLSDISILDELTKNIRQYVWVIPRSQQLFCSDADYMDVQRELPEVETIKYVCKLFWSRLKSHTNVKSNFQSFEVCSFS